MSITTQFPSQVKTFQELFQQPVTGYYIPNYQRPYSWTPRNADQLLSDVITGTQSLVKSGRHDEDYRFLGTIITVPITSARAAQIMYPVDHDAIPAAVNIIIDGQQRLSTLSIFAMVLYDYIAVLTAKICREYKNTDVMLIREIKEICNRYQRDLAKLFVIDFSYGNPTYKPIIIRADDDKWMVNGDSGYSSDLAQLIAQFSRHSINTKIDVDSYRKFIVDSAISESNVGKNYKRIYRVMNSALNIDSNGESLDETEDDLSLPTANELVSSTLLVRDILMTTRPSILNHVQNDVMNVKQFVQLLGLSYFLLKRCLVNHVQPQSETWAFDMFQALNSTGEPLTSFDIFKAVMLQRLPSENRIQVKNNITELYSELEVYLGTGRDAKNRKINELMTILGLSYGGEQINKVTSEQKKWLTDVYETNGQLEYSLHYQMVIKRIKCTMDYLNSIESLQASKTEFISGLPGQLPSLKLRNEAMFCLLFLQDAGHSIVQGVLNNAYFQLIENVSMEAKEAFCQIARAVTAFYALWWPINRTNKLPKIHRDIMNVQGWKKMYRMDVQQIKDELKRQVSALPDRDTWIAMAADRLRYGAGSDKLVRLALYVSMWNTTRYNGHLVPMMGDDTDTSLTAARWCSDSFLSIEHIAPQTKTNEWDDDIYPEYVHRIGNLVLLATETNSGTGNKAWAHKWIYYSFTAETDIDKQNSLRSIATDHNIVLDEDVIRKLQCSTYNKHLDPILQLGISYKWDKTTIDQRSLDICTLLYDRMLDWLQ